MKVQATPQTMPKKLDLTTFAKHPVLSGSSNCQHLSKVSAMFRMLLDHQALRFSLEQSCFGESLSTCSSFRRCSYEQIHPHHLQSTLIYKLFYKSTYTKARNVFVSLSAHVCEWVYQCITVCLLHPVALFVCRWVSPFTSCKMLMYVDVFQK